AAEAAVGQGAAVFTGKGHALRHRLVNDVVAQLGQAVHVGLAGAVVAAFDGIVEQPPDAVAVVLVVLGGGDAALRGHAVGPPGRVLNAEVEHVVAQLAQGRGRRSAGQPGAHDDDGVAPPVGRVH